MTHLYRQEATRGTIVTANELKPQLADHALMGSTFRYIRMESGFSAREFAYLCEIKGARIRSARAVYDMESDNDHRPIKRRYADYLKELVGAKNYNALLLEKLAEDEAIERERRARIAERDEARRQEEAKLEALTVAIRNLLVERGGRGCTIGEMKQMFSYASSTEIKEALKSLRERKDATGSLALNYTAWRLIL